MNQRAAAWLAGGVLTVAAHGGLAWMLAVAVAPDPLPEPAAPEAVFDIGSYPVRETVAEERPAESAEAEASPGTGVRASAAAIPRSSAARLSPASQALPPAAPNVTPLPGSTGAADRIAIRHPEAAPVEPGQLAAVDLAARQPAAQVVAGTPPDAPPAVPPVQATGESLSSFPAVGDAMQPVEAPLASALAEAPATGTTGQPFTPEAPLVSAVAPETGRANAVVAEAEQASAIAADAGRLSADIPEASRVSAVVADTLSVTANVPEAPRVTAVRADAGKVPAITPDARPGAALRLPVAQASAATATSLAIEPAQPSASAQPVVSASPAGQALVASASAPPPLAVAAAAARGEGLAASATGGRKLARVAAQSVRLAVRADLGALAAPQVVSASALLASVAMPGRPAKSVIAASASVPTVDARAAPAASVSPPTVAAPQGDTAGLERPAAALAVPAERRTAALAWSGGGEGDIDPVSLAAIQSFAQVGDPGPQAAQVRDQIGTLLAAVPCARLQTVFDPATGALELRGHIPEEALRPPVLAALAAQIGNAIPLIDDTVILPRPICGVLADIDAVGLAQSDEQEGDPRVVGKQPFAAIRQFSEGDVLAFELQGPDYPAFFYVDYFDAEGQVVHLQPNELVPLRQIAARATEVIGTDIDGRPAIRITVTPPFGREVLAAFATSVPLFDGLRPTLEPARPYLEFIRVAVARKRAELPDFRGEWFYFISVTAPR